jgi:hypothetical protein
MQEQADLGFSRWLHQYHWELLSDETLLGLGDTGLGETGGHQFETTDRPIYIHRTITKFEPDDRTIELYRQCITVLLFVIFCILCDKTIKFRPIGLLLPPTSRKNEVPAKYRPVYVCRLRMAFIVQLIDQSDRCYTFSNAYRFRCCKILHLLAFPTWVKFHCSRVGL